MKFEIYKGKDSPQWRIRLRAGNGEIIIPSEGYHNEQDARHAIALIQATDITTPIEKVQT